PRDAELCDADMQAATRAMWLTMVPKLHDQHDRLNALEAVDVPTLLLAGEQDAGFLPDMERLAKSIPGAELVVLPDAGHSPQFENPDAWWDALTSFLDRLVE